MEDRCKCIKCGAIMEDTDIEGASPADDVNWCCTCPDCENTCDDCR